MPAQSESARFGIFRNIVEAIATDKQNLCVKEVLLAEKAILTISCSEIDYPKLVGKRGANVNALQLIYAIAAFADGVDGVVKVSPPDNANRPPRLPFKFNPSWGVQNFRDLIAPLCKLVLVNCLIDVSELNRETILLGIKVRNFDGETFRSSIGRAEPISFNAIADAFDRVLKSAVKVNGRDLELEMTNSQ